MPRYYEIAILDQPTGKPKQRWPVRPSKRTRYQARRGVSLMQFYDLGWINTGTVGSPVWSDHPILKVPSYTTSASTSGFTFLGVEYNMDPFGNSDYQAYTDMFFGYGAVTEWKNLFRRMETADDFFFLQLRKKPQTGLVDTAEITGSGGHLSDWGFSWLGASGTQYRGFNEITYLANLIDRRWFSGSTGRKSIYFCTASYDATAPDVSPKIAGPVDVYLMPHIGMFLAASYEGGSVASGGGTYDGTNGVQVLGPWYQIDARDHLPTVISTDDPENVAYIEYQRGRTDAQASEWVFTSGTSYTINTGFDPTTFYDGNRTFKSTIDNTGSTTFYNGTAQVFYRSTLGVHTFFERTEPFLMAVIKINGSFYYIWSVWDGFSEAGSDESNEFQGFNLSQYPAGDEAP